MKKRSQDRAVSPALVHKIFHRSRRARSTPPGCLPTEAIFALVLLKTLEFLALIGLRVAIWILIAVALLSFSQARASAVALTSAAALLGDAAASPMPPSFREFVVRS